MEIDQLRLLASILADRYPPDTLEGRVGVGTQLVCNVAEAEADYRELVARGDATVREQLRAAKRLAGAPAAARDHKVYGPGPLKRRG